MYRLAVDLLGMKKGASVVECADVGIYKIEDGHTMRTISEFDFNTFLSHRLIEEIQEPRWTDDEIIEFAMMFKAQTKPEIKDKDEMFKAAAVLLGLYELNKRGK